MKSSAIMYAEAGFTIIKLVGKKPAEGWKGLKYRPPEEVAQIFDKWNGNFGVVLSPTDLVIDYDPRNEKPGDRSIQGVLEDTGLDLKKAFLVKTGSMGKGFHAYFRLPEDFHVQEKLEEKYGNAVEFKSRGRQVAGAGCIHPETGKVYKVMASGQNLENRGPAPEALLDLIRKVPRAPSSKEDIGEVKDEDELIVEKYVEILLQTDPAVQGDSGDKVTFTVACQGRDLGLSEGKVYELMSEHFNPRCVPCWSEEELLKKVDNAFIYATGSKGEALAETDFKAIKRKRIEKFRWNTTKGGKMEKTVNNITNFFKAEDSPLYETLIYNEFTGQIRIIKPLPWWPDQERNIPKDGFIWSEDDSIELRVYLGREKDFDANTKLMSEAILHIAKWQSYHPIKDWLNGLQWDGKKRLETWLIDTAGADDNIYIRAVSKLLLMQAVERIYHPGCKADYMPVLEGPQGIGKSTIIEILGGEFYGDIYLDPSNKDTVDSMRRLWFVEVSEMVAYSKSDIQALKSFITRKTDNIRFAYAYRSTEVLRQCVLIGTLNPDATGQYLPDETGNRRTLPVPITGFLKNGVWLVDFDALIAMRDQLFAEAAEMVLCGELSYIRDVDVLKMAEAEQQKRQISEPWITRIGEWLEEKKIYFVTSRDIWIHAMMGADATLNNSHIRRITRCLKELGYLPKVIWDNNKSRRGFAKEEYNPKPKPDIFS